MSATVSLGPKFANPLSQEGNAALGEFNVTWSQIDFMVTACIGLILKTQQPVTDTYLNEQSTGQRIGLLRRVKDLPPDEHVRSLINKFVKEIGPLIEKRNHLAHGVWGWENVSPQALAGCHFHKREQPIYATELPTLIQTANNHSHAIHEIMVLLANLPADLIDNRTVTFWIRESSPPGWQD